MSGIRTRADAKAFVLSQLPSGTGAITAANLRETLDSLIDSMASRGEVAVLVENMTTNTPPSNPVDGEAYVVGASPTGAWVGYARRVAIWDGSISPSAWFFPSLDSGDLVVNRADATIYIYDDTNSPTEWTAISAGGSAQTESLIVAVSDETTVLTTGAGKVTFRMPYAFTLSAVRASLTTVGAGIVTVDINEGGSSILSTKLTIDANEKTSTTAATSAVISDAGLADDAEITIDIDTDGSDTSVSPTEASTAAGLKVVLIGTQA